MSAISFSFKSPESRQDELVAWLDEPETSGLLQDADLVTVYAAETDAEVVRELIRNAPTGLVVGVVSEESIADRNWNAEWEKTITPIVAGPFRVRPTWETSEPSRGQTDIIVDPKMSFGTGHHESTRLLLGSLAGKVVPGSHVLDAGTGTGVLAFAALLLGAVQADAFDYDPLCIENATENATLNQMRDRFRVFEDDGSGLDEWLGHDVYDVVTANINREVLRSMLPELVRRLKPGGFIGLAGLLVTDASIMHQEIEGLGLVVEEESQEGSWWSVWARSSSAGSAGAGS